MLCGTLNNNPSECKLSPLAMCRSAISSLVLHRIAILIRLSCFFLNFWCNYIKQLLKFHWTNTQAVHVASWVFCSQFSQQIGRCSQFFPSGYPFSYPLFFFWVPSSSNSSCPILAHTNRINQFITWCLTLDMSVLCTRGTGLLDC